MSIEVELPDGNVLSFPDGTDKSVIEQTARRAIDNPYSLKSTKELEAAPAAPSTFKDVSEFGAMSLAGGIKSLTDLFGVDTAASKKMEELQQEAFKRLSPERQRELAIEEELKRRADEEGSWSGIKQAGKSFLRSPLQQTIGAGFSSLPVIAGTALAPEVSVPARIAAGTTLLPRITAKMIASSPAIGIGAGMGVGGQKGQDYAAVKQAMLDKGATEEEAEAAAIKASEYSLQNAPRQIGAGIAGGAEGALGVESLLGRAGRARAGVRGGPEAPTWGQAVGQSTFGEAIPEAIQSGVGAVGTNVALQQAGIDTDLFKGVAGEMTSGALAAAMLGTAVSPLQMRQLRQEFARDQLEKELADQKQKFEEYQKKQAEIAKTKENLGTQTTLALPAPAPKVEEKDPLQNPLGNLTKNELGPEVVGYIEQYRTANGMPLLNSYSIEDVKDAMTQVNPAGEAAALDSLVAAKSGYQPDVTYSAQDVLNAATNKVDTTTQGFLDFLNRTTGSSDLNTMSQPQLYAAFKALEGVPVGQGLTILPEGSNASRFTEIQMVQGLDAIAAELGKNQALTPEQTITKVKEATGLKNDRDAASLIKQLVKDNNLDTNADGNIIAPTEIKNLPAGYTLEKGTFKQSDQQLYGVLSDGKPLEGVDTYTNPQDAQAKVDALNKTRETQAKAVEQTIKKIQDQIDQSQQNLDAMEAAGEGGTDAYKQAKAQHEALVNSVTDNISNLQARQMMFQTPLTMGPVGMKQVNRTGFTLFKDGVPVSTHPTADAAMDSLVGTLPEAEVEALAQDKTPGMRTVARKARQRIERQSRPARKEPEQKAPEVEVTEEDKKNAQVLAKALSRMLKKFGLGDVKLQILKGMQDEGSYVANLIKIALDAKDAIGVLRHESIHALKDLGFFTDAQWATLERMAREKWVDQYLRNVKHDDNRSRYDAYKEMFEMEAKRKGLTGVEADSYVDTAIIEEAVADAFRAFGKKPPPGLLTAIVNKIKEFFARLKEAFNMAGIETAEQIFGRIERGGLKPSKQQIDKAMKHSLRIMRGEEDPNIFGKVTVDKVAGYFDGQVMTALGRKLDYNKQSDFDWAFKMALEEVKHQLKMEKSGLDWYEEDVQKAFRETAKSIPQLKKEKNRILFSIIAGIMSPQTTARDNWFIAAKAFKHYVDTGNIPGLNPETNGLWQGGTQSPNKKIQLEFLDRMVKDMGEKKAIEWLLSDHTVKEINQFRSKYGNIKSGIDGKMNDVLPGLYAFGPKVGPFVSNLNGIHDVTVDKWMTRTFNRYFGTMLGPDGKIVDAPTEPQRRAIKKLINEVAKDAGIKPYQVQSVLWFYEQGLFTKMGAASPSYGFSDGAEKYTQQGRDRGGEKGISDAVGKAEKRSIKGEADEEIRSTQPAVRPSLRGREGIEEDEKARQRGDRERRRSRRGNTPLAGAPIIDGATGPDPEIVRVAEEYAANNNIPYAPQAAYVEIDEDRAKRLAQAYEDMPHAPQNPAVRAAYKDLIDQTKAQYYALIDAGYEFSFFDSNTDPYDGNPWNAMRDLRQNKKMAVYGTYDGYGTEGITGAAVEDNPMLEDTGLRWKDQNGVEQIVTANDLFRAVHDAFGHGLEGAGFRARGEENAWQAHARLFTGPALGAITSETRGQNSWLNYGPYGENNRTAKLEDTVFAEQKTGLMPEWTWTEGMADSEGVVLGEKQPSAQSYEGMHYGNAQVDTLLGSKWGTGIKGAERRRLENAWDDRIKNRVYFYINKEDGSMPLPEAGLGQYVYTQKFDNILGPGAEMSKLFSQAQGDPNKFETAVVDAGYDGYAVPNMGMMVILNHDAPVQYLGTRNEVSAKKSLRAPDTKAFKQWFGDSDAVDKNGNPLIVYTATNKDFTVFEPGRGASKDAISAWVTSDKNFVNNYASVKFRWWKTMHLPWEDDRMIPNGVNIIPAYVNPKNPFDVTNLIDDLSAPINDDEAENVAKELRISKAELLNAIPKKDVYPNGFEKEHTDISSDLVRTQVAVDAMRKLGFDSVKAREAGSVVYALFDSDQIKSAISNVGTYSGPDIRKSLRAPDTKEFNDWFDDSKVVDKEGRPVVMYHGTARDISEFKPGVANAIFISPDPEFAEIFSEDSFNWLANNAKDELSEADQTKTKETAIEQIEKDYEWLDKKDPDYKKLLAHKEGMIKDIQKNAFKKKLGDEAMGYLATAAKNYLPTGPNIMPLFVRALNPFDYENKKHIDMVVGRVLNYMPESVTTKMEFPEKYLAGLKGLLSRGLFTKLEEDAVQKAIRSLGFDSFYVKEMGRKNLAVYSPVQVKSATGNIGTYGLNDPDIRKSMRSKGPDVPERLQRVVNETVAVRDEESWLKRLMSAIVPSESDAFRQAVFNRYQRIGTREKKAAQKDSLDQYTADVSAEFAALHSDYAAELMASAMGAHDGKGGIPVFRNGMTMIWNDDGKITGPLDIFQPLAKLGDKAFQHWQFWKSAQRGERLDRVNGKPTQFGKDELQAAKELEALYPPGLFQEVDKAWDKYNRGLVNYMIDTGVISRGMGEEWMKHSDYFPFYRQQMDEDAKGPKMFSAISGVKAPKELKGGDMTVGDFFENVIRNTQSAIEAGMKNVAADRAIKNELILGDAKEVVGFKGEPKRPQSMTNVVTVLRNGVTHYYECKDKLFVEAMKGLNMAEIPGLWLFSAPANLLRSFVTKTPDFILANLLRDSMSAWVTSGANITPVIDTAKGFGAALAGTDPDLQMLYNFGLIGGHEFSGKARESGRTLARRMRKQAGVKTTGEKVLTPVTAVWEALEKGSTASDAATRLAVYKNVMEETGNQAEALKRAMEIMNFQRKGNSALMRVLAAAIPFLNARLQGLDVFYRAGIKPFVDPSNASEYEKQVAKAFIKRGTLMMAMSVFYYMMVRDDEDYLAQEEEVRDNNWIIPGLGVKITIPFEVGIVFKTIPERITALMLGNDTGAQFMDSTVRNLKSTFGLQLPQAILPMIEVATGHSFFTRRAITPQGLEDVQKRYQVAPGTSRLAEVIGEFTSFSTAAGQSVGLSPIELDHLIKGYTGTLGTYFVDAVDVLINANSDIKSPSKRFEQMPFIRRFALDPDARGNVTAYYELKNAVDEVVRTSNLLERTGKVENYVEYQRNNMPMIASKDYVNDLYKSMKEFNEMKRQIRSSPMDPDDKRDIILSIEQMENALTAQIKEYRKMIAE